MTQPPDEESGVSFFNLLFFGWVIDNIQQSPESLFWDTGVISPHE
jgi:hypothetical protein